MIRAKISGSGVPKEHREMYLGRLTKGNGRGRGYMYGRYNGNGSGESIRETPEGSVLRLDGSGYGTGGQWACLILNPLVEDLRSVVVYTLLQVKAP
jgi:hypothetical protein